MAERHVYISMRMYTYRLHIVSPQSRVAERLSERSFRLPSTLHPYLLVTVQYLHICMTFLIWSSSLFISTQLSIHTYTVLSELLCVSVYE